MESEGGNRKPQTVHLEPSHDGDPIVEGKLSCSSSSCSSSASSFDPLTDSDHGGKEDILGNSTLPTGPRSPTAEFVIRPETSENPKTPEWSMISVSPRAGPENSSSTPKWSMVSASLKQSPPIQTMWRPVSGYDPHRIPSSIFTSKPNATMDWSVASNESLFSIQMGNTSFSGNYAILSGKSQELGRPDEFSNCNFTQIQSPVCEIKSNELNRSPPTPILPTVIEAVSDDRASSASSREEKTGIKEVVDEKLKVVMKETVEQEEVHAKPKVVVKETEEDAR
ncbi:uncharacterized protein LOC130768732 isoform X1 [Actinidia eriantha]|uniref:uncharacterized protein LOC130768732 isoform X1 n=1 Tax=Actinidia eriantha TaxID=165200 RepID=UPI00258D5C05|nr:uncharacterized protein LOC130768732 isoform X1 [Actinidia eriantha]